jgi:hypothetical protein
MPRCVFGSAANMNWGQLIFSVVLILAGSFAILVNGWIFWESIINKRHTPSVIPIVGGIFAAVGITVFPAERTWMWAWLPIVVDWGGLPVIVVAWWRGAFK